MNKQKITIEFDLDQLSGYTDEYLATLWHVGQANPAPFGDYWSGEIVRKLSYEIVSRWLRHVDPPLYTHQPTHNYHKALTSLAVYNPPEDTTTGDPRWYEGTWTVKAGEPQR